MTLLETIVTLLETIVTHLETIATLELHWLRPFWLLGAIPALLLAWFLLRQPLSQSRWKKVIDPSLLPALLQGSVSQYAVWPVRCLLLGWLLGVLALAGPSWEKATSNTLKQADAVVIILDLSPSMLVKDVSPTRLQAAQFKVLDLLKQRREGYTGLVAYSGSAHVVAPLSDDTNTIAALVPSLEPGIMPKMGSQTEEAITVALGLLENANFPRGRLLLITDGVVPEVLSTVAEQLRNKNVTLHVIGVGTALGGPIPLERGGYIQDANGKMQLFPFSEEPLKKLAYDTQGQYSELRMDDADIAPLAALPPWLAELDKHSTRESSHTLEHWQDKGYWLIFPLLVMTLVAFRRGLVVSIIPLLLIVSPEKSHALDWKNLWYTPDQQAKQKLDGGDPVTAAELFENPQWKGYAEYQAGQHEQAAEHFASERTAEALYNQANALAKSNQLDEAIKLYDEAIKQKQDFSDARDNKKIVEDLKKQQQQEQEQKQNDQDQSESSDQNQKKDPNQQQEQKQQQQQNQSQQDSQSPQDSKPSEQSSDSQSNPDAEKSQDDQQKPAENSAEEQQESQKAQQAADKKQQETDKQQQEEREKAKQDEQAKKSDAESAGSIESNTAQESPEDAEKRQATEQWLRKVPDDPGGLLRNKFNYYYQENQREENKRRRSGNSSDEQQRW